jgi:hypothetical protein
MKLPHERQDLEVQIEKLVEYIHLKIEQADWHGVSDAANDIRELEAQLRLYKIMDLHEDYATFLAGLPPLHERIK